MKVRRLKNIKYYNYTTGNATVKEVKEQVISSWITVNLQRLNILFWNWNGEAQNFRSVEFSFTIIFAAVATKSLD